jgi:hypothetical protein
MKKVLLLMALMLFPLVAAPQTKYGVTVGILPGTSVSESHHFSGDRSPVGFNSKATYSAGITALMPLGGRSMLHTTIKYVSRTVSTFRYGPADGALFLTLNYRSLNLSTKFSYNLLNVLNIGIGPSVDLNLANSEHQVGDYAIPNPRQISGTENLRLGGVISLGYMLDVWKSVSIFPELSYELGLSKTNEFYGGRYSNVLISVSMLGH